jgi:cation:H+ antiporter
MARPFDPFADRPKDGTMACVAAATTGIEETIVGVVLVAISPSLPEFVASLAALRIDAYDRAVSKLFGSNVADMAVLVLFDAAYTPGPLLAAVDPAQTAAAQS